MERTWRTAWRARSHGCRPRDVRSPRAPCRDCVLVVALVGERHAKVVVDYDFPRKDIMPAIYAYPDCRIPENRAARVGCECGSDLFVAFSCKKRMICPSCATKRSILFAEKVREIVKPVFTFFLFPIDIFIRLPTHSL